MKCSVEGCAKEANRKGAGLCEAHYMRKRRTGDPLPKPRDVPELAMHSNGYLLRYAPHHHLSQGSSRAYDHRLVFHAQHGEGPFCCHWCGCKVTWQDMHVDHVNDDKRDNAPDNLVASCPTCNQARGRWKIVRHWRQQRGLTLGQETLTVNEWARRAGISRSAFLERLRKGWSLDAAVHTPRGRFGPQGGGCFRSQGFGAS